MDALPVAEKTGIPFASTNGAMHACGHDLHTAGLIGAARLLSSVRDSLTGDVIFMFQPGEEGHEGARIMLEEGVLNAAGRRPDAAYALHVVSDIPSGVFTTRAGSYMAAFGDLSVKVIGRGGHGSRPFQALDPIQVAAEMLGALQTYITRRFNVLIPWYCPWANSMAVPPLMSYLIRRNSGPASGLSAPVSKRGSHRSCRILSGNWRPLIN